MSTYYINNYYRVNIRDYTDFGLEGGEFCNSSVYMTDTLSKISPDIIYNSIVKYDIQKLCQDIQDFKNAHIWPDLSLKNFKETKTNDMYDYDIYQNDWVTYIGWGRVKITDTIETI